MPRPETTSPVGAVKPELDFIVIGAQKAGTTSLFEYLRRHPELRLPAGKEAPYFSHDERYASDWEDYLRKHFAFADPNQKWGTVTPHYMVGGVYGTGTEVNARRVASDERTVPLRIRQRLPGVRLVAILRDPVERARSHHTMATMNGWEARTFDEAICELLHPRALERARQLPEETTGYVVWGEYGRILSGYLDVFRREQLLVVQMDDLRVNPAVVLRRVHRFLGVADDFLPDNLGVAYRVSGAARRLSWMDLNALQRWAAQNARLHGLWHAVPEPARRRIDDTFNRTKYVMDLWNRRETRRADSCEPATISALREHFVDDQERLRARLAVAPPTGGELRP